MGMGKKNARDKWREGTYEILETTALVSVAAVASLCRLRAWPALERRRCLVIVLEGRVLGLAVVGAGWRGREAAISEREASGLALVVAAIVDVCYDSEPVVLAFVLVIGMVCRASNVVVVRRKESLREREEIGNGSPLLSKSLEYSKMLVDRTRGLDEQE